VQGDLHHYEQKQTNEYEFFMFGALVGADQYADVMNKTGRARQNTLILDHDGVREVQHFFLS
jgi:hypothetical protein